MVEARVLDRVDLVVITILHYDLGLLLQNCPWDVGVLDLPRGVLADKVSRHLRLALQYLVLQLLPLEVLLRDLFSV